MSFEHESTGLGLLARDESGLAARFGSVRARTMRLCEPLSAEDHGVQSMPDASPTKWHLAHTTWFFEAFLLQNHLPGYREFHPRYGYLFNSYYNGVGDRVPRGQRGLLTRPGLDEIHRYREHVDGALGRLLAESNQPETVAALVTLGLHHEQQHQELILTDILHAFGCNPLRPAYRERPRRSPGERAPAPLRWLDFAGGLCQVGQAGAGFAFDNERPRHSVFLRPFQLGSRLVTCGEFRAFIDAGGYERPEWWLSDGWSACQAHRWRAPPYWELQGQAWWHLTLDGFGPVRDQEPVCHLSFYEADAFARWAGARLPTEAEWEVAAATATGEGSFLESDRLRPAPAGRPASGPAQMFGELWQWTASPYVAYPGYRPPESARQEENGNGHGVGFSGLSEYNAKFFVNNVVLRGGSCLTPASHFRPTYRNFFPPHARWQFSGIRLARDV